MFLDSVSPSGRGREWAHLSQPRPSSGFLHALGAFVQAKAYGQSQGRPGSRPTQDSALLLRHEPRGLCPCLLSSGGGSVPPMKVVTPGASRLKAAQGPAGSPDKGKHSKQRTEYMRIQAQQQATKPSKEMSGPNETSSPVSEKPSGSRTSIPVLTSFGARNSSISF